MNASEAQDKFRAILVFVALIAVIAFNILAALGYVNGVTTAQISSAFDSILTPAPYAFSIWTLIYIGLIGFAVYQILPANLARFRPVRTFFIASCVLNAAWLYFWHQGRIGVCILVLLTLTSVVGVITYQFRAASTFKEALVTKGVFGLYFGWVTCATLVNVMVWLQKPDRLQPGTALVIAIIFIGSAALLAVAARVLLQNFMFPIAVAWALTAIGVKQSGNTPIVVATAVGTVIALVTAGSIVTRLKDSTSE